MSSDIKVSIVIPAYNEEKDLPACLQSLQDLNYPHAQIEIIVVDNGSTDRTREIASDSGAKVLCRQDVNVAALRNLGVQNASGEIIAFMDADCVVTRDWLQNAERYFENPGVVAWGAPPVLPDNPSWVQTTWFLVRQKGQGAQETEWLETMNLFVKRATFDEIGGFNESLQTCEDVDFSYRLRKLGKIISDARIEMVHLGEARTVREFIRKEVWRGRSSLTGMFSHGLSLQELPSLSIPAYFGVVLPLLLVGFMLSGLVQWLLAFLCLYLLPTLLAIVKIRLRNLQTGLRDTLRLAVLLQVYFLSRTVAAFR